MRKFLLSLMVVVALAVALITAASPEPALACPTLDIVDCAQAVPPIGK